MFTPEQLNVIKYCAEECIRQGKRDPMSTYNMVNAWDYAAWYGDERQITVDFIENIGNRVEPIDNANGIRTVPVFIGYEKRDAERLHERLEDLIKAYYDGRLDPTDKRYRIAVTSEDVFYFEFENIHPFGDGNGRTGKILYNYLLGNLKNPVMPPNFWNIANP